MRLALDQEPTCSCRDPIGDFGGASVGFTGSARFDPWRSSSWASSSSTAQEGAPARRTGKRRTMAIEFRSDRTGLRRWAEMLASLPIRWFRDDDRPVRLQELKFVLRQSEKRWKDAAPLTSFEAQVHSTHWRTTARPRSPLICCNASKSTGDCSSLFDFVTRNGTRAAEPRSV